MLKIIGYFRIKKNLLVSDFFSMVYTIKQKKFAIGKKSIDENVSRKTQNQSPFMGIVTNSQLITYKNQQITMKMNKYSIVFCILCKENCIEKIKYCVDRKMIVGVSFFNTYETPEVPKIQFKNQRKPIEITTNQNKTKPTSIKNQTKLNSLCGRFYMSFDRKLAANTVSDCIIINEHSCD